MLKRKIENYLIEWKKSEDRLPLIIKGARQIGKTYSIMKFAKENYENIIEINFVKDVTFKDIFNNGYEIDNIIKEITFRNTKFKFIPNKTLIFFDEIQDCPNAATSLKFFKLDGRFDVICSGSLMGLYYEKIESNSVGYKEDYEMHSLDFEEFLWAKGYKDNQLEDIYQKLLRCEPLNKIEYDVMIENFREYMVVGGMPKIVDSFINENNYGTVLKLQKQIIKDYEEDITKYAEGLDKSKILDVYRAIPTFLGKDNKKFQISKIKENSKSRDYIGVVDWLINAGMILKSTNMTMPELPLKGNSNPDNFRLYFADTGLLIASLDEEAQEDLRMNKNFNTYKGAIYENIIADILNKEGYELHFYKKDDSEHIEIDFLVRDKDSLIPLEVKAKNNKPVSMLNMIHNKKYTDVVYGIKLADANIGYNGEYYTIPYHLAYCLKRFLKEKNNAKKL